MKDGHVATATMVREFKREARLPLAFKTRWLDGWLVWQRALVCFDCRVSWYDGEQCPRCGEAGEPEPLPDGAVPVDDKTEV